jgi:hypothetical protein
LGKEASALPASVASKQNCPLFFPLSVATHHCSYSTPLAAGPMLFRAPRLPVVVKPSRQGRRELADLRCGWHRRVASTRLDALPVAVSPLSKVENAPLVTHGIVVEWSWIMRCMHANLDAIVGSCSDKFCNRVMLFFPP